MTEDVKSVEYANVAFTTRREGTKFQLLKVSFNNDQEPAKVEVVSEHQYKSDCVIRFKVATVNAGIL